MTTATQPLRSFYNDSYDTVFIVTINGDEGSYILADEDGDAIAFSNFRDAIDARDATGDFGDVNEVEYHETLDLDMGW